MKVIAIIALAALSGCATVKRITPEQAAVGVGIFIATSLAISAGHHGHQREPLSVHGPDQLPCYPQPNGSCR